MSKRELLASGVVVSPAKALRRHDLFLPRPKIEIIPTGGGNHLARSDALAFCQALRDGIADIVFLDPPFNLGKDYGIARWLEDGDADSYEFYLKKLIREAVRILKPGAALFLYHLPYWASRLSHELQQSLEFRHWIAVAMKNGFVRGRNLYPADYALLYYTKGRPTHFARLRLQPQLCRHCGGFVKDYGGYTNIIRGKGINLSDFWEDLSPVRHKSRKLRKANQLPVALTDRVVATAGTPGGLLVDPFVGTGTSLVSAKRAEMFFVGNDLSRSSLRICMARLDSAKQFE